MQNKILLYLMVAFLVIQNEICFATERVYPCSDYSTLVDTVQIETKQTQTPKRYTIEMYRAIKRGMSYQQCVDILGSEGSLFSESDSSVGVMEIYNWKNDDHSFIQLVFWDYLLKEKRQTGLR